MIKKLFFTVMMAVCMTVTGMAQENMYLIKGNQVVAKYGVDEVDYVSFKLPEGVTENQILINVDEVGKNYFTYTVKTLSADKQYVHAFVQKSMLDIFLLSYYGTMSDDADPELVKNALKRYLNNGYLGQGTRSYTIQDGESDGYSDFEVIAGQSYFVVAGEYDAIADDLGEEVNYTIVTTLPAGRSTETITATYTGLNEKNEAMFSFTASSGVTKICTMLGLKSVLEQFINVYGFDFTMFAYAGRFAPENLIPGDGSGWPVTEEDDYVMYVIGIDAEGNMTETQKLEMHIVPQIPEEVGPQIKIFSKEKDANKVSVNFEITPSNVTKAYVRLMDENDCDDLMNEGHTLPELAAGSDAVDITESIRTTGEYTYTNNEVPQQWCSLLIMGVNDEGTTITRINFWPDTQSEWDIHDNLSFETQNTRVSAQKPSGKKTIADTRAIVKSMTNVKKAFKKF